jgi:hypothetical protein
MEWPTNSTSSRTQHERSYLSFKLLLLASLVLTLCQVNQYDVSNEEDEGVPAFVWALKHNEPSLRVFRCLYEFALVLVGTSISLRVWEHTFDRSLTNEEAFGHQGKSINEYLGINVIGHLLFRPASSEVEDTVDALVAPVEHVHEIDHENETQELVFETHKASLTKKYHDFQPPTSIAVANAAIDVLIFLTLLLLLFTVGCVSKLRLNEGSDNISMFQRVMAGLAPVFPLIAFFVLALKAFLPWSTRSLFWKVVLLTLEAPWREVSFRDGIVGDIATSVVRPAQDIVFACFYTVSVVQIGWSSTSDLKEAAEKANRNWLLNNAFIPLCMILPLWFRFMQCLRQCYEARKRWPYLGNAMKYMFAAEVAMFGAFDPEKKKSFSWNACFFIATFYQTFWDVFFDWEIFKIKFNEHQQELSRAKAGFACCGKNDICISLRDKRLYSHKNMYYTIFVINLFLRFFWTLSLIPSNHLSRSGKLIEQVGIGIQRYATSMIAIAEIIRRTCWGLLRVELEAIKLIKDAEIVSYDMTLDEMQPMPVTTGVERSSLPSRGRDESQRFALGSLFGAIAVATDTQIIRELCIWTAVFISFGIFAVANAQ